MNALKALTISSEDDLEEVTQILDEAREVMEASELIHTEGFTLFEAMSAVEVGEPRMDIGMHINQDNAGSPDELIEVRSHSQA